MADLIPPIDGDVAASAMRFTALVDFAPPETKSQYVKGLSYTARTERLQKLVGRWAADGRVELGGGKAEMKGEG